MKKTLLAIAILAMGIASTQAATLYLGDGSSADISGAFSSGSQNWDTSAANWTPTTNPTAYQTYVTGSDIIALGDLPIVTVTENITVNNIGRETQFDANGNRMDLIVGAGNTLTINGTIDATPYGLDGLLRQYNINGPGNLAGSFSVTNAARILLNTGLTVSPGTVMTFNGANNNDIRFQSGLANTDLGNLSLILDNAPRIDNNTGNNSTLILGSVEGSGVMDLGNATATLKLNNSQIGGAGAIGTLTQTTGTGSLSLTNGTHTFDIDASLKTADKLTVTSKTLTLGGTLTVANIAGSVESGDVYTLFAAPSYAGSFTTIDLPTIAPLLWNTDNLAVDGTISAGGLIVSNYTGTLYLGNGTVGAGGSYTNSPVTWDTNSIVWGVGPNPTETLHTNWIDGADAIFNGTTSTRVVNLATNLSVIVDELEWAGEAALQFTGTTNVAWETITITNELRTALAKTARQVTLQNVSLGGDFTMQNISRLSFEAGSQVESNTVITVTDGSDIQFSGGFGNYSELSIQANGSTIYNNSSNTKSIGSLSGFGVIRVNAGGTLTLNNFMGGGISNSASFTSTIDSVGNVQMGSGTHNFSLNPATLSTDLLEIGTGTNFFGGDLVVIAVNTNKVALGDTFKLFDAGTYAGAFSSIVLPTNSLPAGAVWINNLETSGTISVGTPGIAYETINFTDFLNESTWGDNTSGATSLSGSITNGAGTILTLTVSNASDTPTDPIWLYSTAIAGIKGGNGNTRLDSFDAGVTNTANDEIIRLELSIGGTAVDSLGLKSLLIDSYAVGEIAEFSDGITSTQFMKTVSTEGVVSYDDVLAGLTELTAANTGSWKLDVASRDNNNATLNTFSLDEIKFIVGYQFQSTFDIWSESYNLTGGAGDDDDNDGVSNLSEYGLNGDPTNAANRGVVEFGASEDGLNFIYTYARRTASNSGISYSLATSEDLVYDNAWTNNDTVVDGIGPEVDGFDTVTNSTATDVGSKFIQLFIEEN